MTWLCRGFTAQEADLNFIYTPLSPLNYSSRDGAPETTALGDKGCCQHYCTANVLFHTRARGLHFGVQEESKSYFRFEIGSWQCWFCCILTQLVGWNKAMADTRSQNLASNKSPHHADCELHCCSKFIHDPLTVLLGRQNPEVVLAPEITGLYDDKCLFLRFLRYDLGCEITRKHFKPILSI